MHFADSRGAGSARHERFLVQELFLGRELEILGMDGFDDLLDDAAFACGDGDGDEDDSGRAEKKVDGSKLRAQRAAKTKADAGDDVDDLLRELELDDAGGAAQAKHTSKNKNKHEPAASSKSAFAAPSRETKDAEAWDDWDDDSAGEEQHVAGSKAAVLGGEAASLSRNGSLAMRVASSRLRCVKCDFEVERWPGCAWKADADYMFFRNAAPDRVSAQKKNGTERMAPPCWTFPPVRV